MLTIVNDTLQAEPAFKSPLDKQLAQNRGAIKLHLSLLRDARLTAVAKGLSSQRDYIKSLQSSLVDLRAQRTLLRVLEAQAAAMSEWAAE